ncbi:MAG: response regulator [Candidatus Edwardsbacteria bacterium]
MKKILIADDDKNILFFLSELLQRSDYEIVQAVDGEQALKFAREQKPALILLDIMMPGLDGLEVCRQLKTDPETKQIKIIMVTAKTTEPDIERGLAAGADFYIPKPFKISVLSEKIRELLEKKKEEQTRKI